MIQRSTGSTISPKGEIAGLRPTTLCRRVVRFANERAKARPPVASIN